MPRFVRVLVAAALAVMIGVATPAAAAVTDVLTLGSVGGPNVAVGDVLKSGLMAGTVVTFGTLVTCAASTMGVTVTSNPPAGNVATGSLSALSYASCTSSSGMACPASTATNLPYTINISGAGNVVTLSTYSVIVRVCTPVGTANCVYSFQSMVGSWSNTDSSIALAVMLIKSGGPVLCNTTLTMRATYAPVVDTSGAAAQRVFAQ
jgi:hypothetical protein